MLDDHLALDALYAMLDAHYMAQNTFFPSCLCLPYQNLIHQGAMNEIHSTLDSEVKISTSDSGNMF